MTWRKNFERLTESANKPDYIIDAAVKVDNYSRPKPRVICGHMSAWVVFFLGASQLSLEKVRFSIWSAFFRGRGALSENVVVIQW